jgi:1-acyl-sn-glycerol-3-phosphate acyltransferase
MECEDAAHLRQLTELNIDDLLTAFGVAHMTKMRPLLRWLCRRPAEQFARRVLAYDAAVGRGGLAAGGQVVLDEWTRSATFHGQEHVPVSGPVLIVANHPGLTDALALFVALPRTDIRVIAAERVFLDALPHTLPYLLLSGDTPARRQSTARGALRHLKQGGTLITFPAGRIEPDPALFPAALSRLEEWRGHFDIFPRLVPDLVIVPTIIDGVTSPASVRNPLVRIRRQQRDRDWLAATLQVLVRRYQQVDVEVTFGQPFRADVYEDVSEAVLAEARRIVAHRVARSSGIGALAQPLEQF